MVMAQKIMVMVQKIMAMAQKIMVMVQKIMAKIPVYNPKYFVTLYNKAIQKRLPYSKGSLFCII